jgi:ectoine hydroxylase-related dioxygenase (phytanoyl-CoA dioxygenase family)
MTTAQTFLTQVPEAAFPRSTADRLYAELDSEGIVVLPRLLSDEQLRGMQRAFETKLRRLRWNNFDGYQRTELYRHMVEDVLLLDQGFVDLALHPIVKQILERYLGANYELTEAKGWKSIPTKRDFHGWHGDAWYDQQTIRDTPREVKLACYLTDVKSGAFNYIRGSHRKQHPRPVRNPEVEAVPESQIARLTGSAGTAFLFDTSGIHRQGVPMLEPRRAIFYNYHDPSVPLQKEDIDYYRYHPLLLNAAFLGNLSDEDRHILGFGNKRNFIPAFERRGRPSALYYFFGAAFNVQLRLSNLRERVSAKLRQLTRRR